MPRILIVDDEPEMLRGLEDNLRFEGYQTLTAGDGERALALALSEAPDLIVLDLMLPGLSGWDVCRALRQRGLDVPVIMLTARGTEADQVSGLELGADDYVTKPFSLRELLARIRAVLRRTRMLPPNLGEAAEPASELAFGDWVLDTTARHLVDERGAVVSLSGAEYRLLRVLLDHPQRVLTRDQLLNLTQGREADVFDRSIDLLISRLRQRLRDEAREARYIKTVRNEGYVFCAAVRRAGARP